MNESKYKLNSTPRGRVRIYLRSWRVLARVYARHVACVDSPRPIDTPLLRPCKDIHEAAIKHLPTRCVCTSILILSAISFAYAFVHTIAYRPSWPHIANMYEPGRLFLARFENRPLVTTLASYSPEIPCFGNRCGTPQFTFHHFTDNLHHNVKAWKYIYIYIKIILKIILYRYKVINSYRWLPQMSPLT